MHSSVDSGTRRFRFPNQMFRLQSRGIARLVAGKGQKLGSFDPRDSVPVPVNPFNLPKPVNNAAGTCA